MCHIITTIPGHIEQRAVAGSLWLSCDILNRTYIYISVKNKSVKSVHVPKHVHIFHPQQLLKCPCTNGINIIQNISISIVSSSPIAIFVMLSMIFAGLIF